MKYTYEFLRKCYGLRFRATLSNKREEGIIKVGEDGITLCYGAKDPGRLFIFERTKTLSFTEQSFGVLPKDFEIVPRDPETYQDWQAGDVICGYGGNKEIIFRSGEVVVFKYPNGHASDNFTCRELFESGFRLVLTDIEEQIIEEQKRWNAEKKVVEDIEPGDDEAAEVQRMISDALKGYIPKGDIEGFPVEVIAKMLERQYEQSGAVDVSVFEKDKIAFAYQSGFDWNRTLEGASFWHDVIMMRDFSGFFKRYPKAEAPGTGMPSFKRFDPVLVRDKDDDVWSPRMFLKNEDDKFYVLSVLGDPIYYNQCIPLNKDTEKLIGTSKQYYEQ